MQVCKKNSQTCIILFPSVPVENVRFINLHNTKYCVEIHIITQYLGILKNFCLKHSELNKVVCAKRRLNLKQKMNIIIHVEGSRNAI